MPKLFRKIHLDWPHGLIICLVGFVAAIQFLDQRVPGAALQQPTVESWIPQFGHGTTQGDLDFSSSIVLLNLSTTTSNVSVASHASSGSTMPLLRDPAGSSTAFRTVSIPGSGTARIDSLNPNPQQFDTGWVGIFSFNNSVLAQVEFSIFSGGVLEARAQIPARPLRSKGSFPIGEDGQSGVAILNPIVNTEIAEVLMASVDPTGDVVDTTMVELNPGERISTFLNQLMSVQGATSAEFRSNVPIALLPLQQDGLVLTTQDIFPARDLTSLFNGN